MQSTFFTKKVLWIWNSARFALCLLFSYAKVKEEKVALSLALLSTPPPIFTFFVCFFLFCGVCFLVRVLFSPLANDKFYFCFFSLSTCCKSSPCFFLFSWPSEVSTWSEKAFIYFYIIFQWERSWRRSPAKKHVRLFLSPYLKRYQFSLSLSPLTRIVCKAGV